MESKSTKCFRGRFEKVFARLRKAVEYIAYPFADTRKIEIRTYQSSKRNIISRNGALRGASAITQVFRHRHSSIMFTQRFQNSIHKQFSWSRGQYLIINQNGDMIILVASYTTLAFSSSRYPFLGSKNSFFAILTPPHTHPIFIGENELDEYDDEDDSEFDIHDMIYGGEFGEDQGDRRARSPSNENFSDRDEEMMVGAGHYDNDEESEGGTENSYSEEEGTYASNSDDGAS
ncbi:uncharacterized protein FA14DRAFT_174084 [Meira miltonrushii]|uniref:Uncharacterized protein n=1 Tax=Meira miltonrushii TaxID=1280837 RepID=A0A316VBD4_9BASI|nr:uncharacterized protein FA14DRAFT_174084 [Meira miltonrushii]PWN34408.1 hypothetical protein FA14DRAFT_174084 [Meira miltonrushii]